MATYSFEFGRFRPVLEQLHDCLASADQVEYLQLAEFSIFNDTLWSLLHDSSCGSGDYSNLLLTRHNFR